MHRRLLLSLVASVVVAVGLLGTNLLLGFRPALGLDLRGGISVTLRPVPGQDYDTASLSLAVERIRERVDSFGVGEPEIVQQDDAIVVNLPGVNDQKKALELVNVTGKVYLRPVLACGAVTPPSDDTSTSTSTSTPTSTPRGDEASTTSGPGTSVASTPSDASVGTGAPGPSRRVSSTPTTDPGATTTSPPEAAPGTATPDTTTPGDTVVPDIAFSDPTQPQVLYNRERTEVCQVGASGGDGTVFVKDTAESRIIGGGWGVTVDLKGGGGGEDIWNRLASSCFNGDETCPTRRLAIELDGVIQSAPTVNEANFSTSVQITGQFSQGEASKLAQVLNSGALPITLQNEAIENVSATLGEDSLQAALVAGSIGVGLVLLFMMLYYRRLAVVVIAGLLISGALIYSASAMISEFYNGVLSLSGIAGLVVSIGVTVDTYVVFFERLKDDVRLGRSLKNSARRGFKSAFRTVLIANTVSLIGAVVLFYLSVGAVRGFAFYLALSTVMDVIVAYFFTGPAVLLLARSRFMSGSKIMGLDIEPTTKLTGATT
ncbi:MAG: protein translocase subunit SecD [Ilumatobacteraceae bacterium]